jgi:hypothetical protein
MSEKAVSNGDDSTESTEYSSVAIGVNMPPVWVDAAGRISTRPGPFQVGGPEVLDAASFVSYDSAAQATIGLDGLGTSDIGHRELPSDSVLTRATDSGGSSVALGTSGSGNGPIWVNGPDIGGNVQMKVPVDGSLNRPADRGTTSVALGSSGEAQPAYTAIGTNGHLMHGVHFRAHDHHRHRAKASAGAPSIAGISDVSQSAGHHSHHTNTIKNSVPTMIGFGHAGDLIFVFDGRLQIGSTTVHADGTWVFTTPALLNGRHDFSVGTINPESGAMLTSNHLGVRVFAEASHAPTAIATITSAIDEVTDPGGNTHQVAMENGSKTSDASPKLVGTLSAALQAGEVLYVYRDGQRMGKADVSGNGWSFQDGDVASGKHVYTAQVESTSGVHGVASGEFALIKEAIMNNYYLFPILATEDYLIVDIRLLGANTRGGQPAAFDFEESVRFMKLAGLNVESYTQTNDFISFKVDWMGYAATHPSNFISLISHDHVDNANGGLDYYNSWGTPLFSTLLNNLGRWTDLMYFMDGAASQSPQPPVDVHITGIYDDVLAPNGESIHTLIPEGGATSSSTHTLVGTLSGPIPRDGGDVVIYRDGVKIAANMFGFRWVTVSGTEWTFEDRDVPPGTHVYTAQIERWYGKQGAISESYSILEAGPIPMTVATITSAIDEITDPGGNLHLTVIENGSKTPDTSPKLIGSVSAPLHDGEVLVVYRDGQKLGRADVSGTAWSFQDADVAAGKHAYTAHVEAATGAQGASSAEFSLTKAALTGTFDRLPVLVTEDFLIVDIRLMAANTRGGSPATFDLEESVKFMKLQGLNVKNYLQDQDFITFEVDWMTYAAAHPYGDLMFVAHEHVDNASGGRDYYTTVGLASFPDLLRQLGAWIPTTTMMDGAAMQSSLPPVDVHIGGVYDGLTLVPDGGSTSGTTHTLIGTLSDTIPRDGGDIVIYRDGVKIAANMLGFRWVTVSGTEWTFEDRDVPPGAHVYTAQIARTYGKQGAMSEGYRIVEAVDIPLPVASITSALDEFTDPGGNHHDNIIQNGGKTAATSPKLLGTLSAALHDGEVLAVYRDGVRLGHADVADLGWSFQDSGLTAGEHIYTARVESASSAPGTMSERFEVVEASQKTFSTFPVMATEDFLIFDTRVISRITPTGEPVTFDLMESVKRLEKEGMTVKSYTDKDGFISIEVDWLAYTKTHMYDVLQFVSHRHVDNDEGGLNYYDTLGVPPLDYLAQRLGTWIETVFVADGAATQSPLPPATTTITGIYDLHTDASGNPVQSLIHNGGSTESSSYKIVGTFSVPLGAWDASWNIYRDGVSLFSSEQSRGAGYDRATNVWWVIDTNVPPGPHVYTARVHRMYGEQGDWSESYSILEMSAAPLVIETIATITSALDEFTDPCGNHHQTVIENGSKTLGTSPRLLGSLSATLLDGEALYVYRDGIKLGHADVSGDTWSFQDGGVAIGSHTYTARVESSSGAQGPLSSNFSLIEASGGEFEKLPLLVTEHFLILDVRGVNWVTASGKPMVPDLTDTVNGLNKLGLAAKVNSTSDGYISIEVDWTAYAETHPGDRIDFVLNLHIDNDSGGLNYYKSINVPSFANLLKVIDTWVPTNFMADGAEWQSATPAPATVITGVYDSYIGADGKPQLMFVPDGGGTAASTHRIEGTLSEPMRMASDWLLIYRDGVKLPGQANAFERGTYSNTTWWFVDTDVPPGPHVYTARVERAYGKQGDWSDSYGVLNANAEPVPDALPPLLMLTDGALIVDVHALTPPNAGGSAASLGLSAELIAGGKTVAVLAVAADAGGLVSFAADWKAVAATHPDATLQISAHNGPDDTATILDKHALSSLLGQTDRWVSMTSTGESAAFFDASDRGAHIHGGAGVNTLAIADDHQLIDLTSLTGKTAASTIMGVEKIDLGGQHNTLKIAMIDVLNLGETDLFRIDGKQQLMVNGKAGDSVKLSNTRVAGIADGEWEQQAETQIGGVTYNIYEHSTAHVELMVQSGVQLTML